MSIVTAEDMKTYLRSDQYPDEAFVTGALIAAHSTFYNMCGRTFEIADTVATPRSYVPSWTDILRIHDCASVTSILSGGTAVTGYQLEPVGPTWAGETRPYEQVRLFATWWLGNNWRLAEASIVVTAKWGWPATPAPAVEAVKVLCKDIVGNRDIRSGFVSFGDAGIAAARRNPFILGVAEQYGRYEATVGIA